jgi:valyl-tRNA synthetase
MPFVTEAIWQALPIDGDIESIMLTRWPERDEGWHNSKAEEQMELVMELVRSIRNVRAEYDVQPGKRIQAIVSAGPWSGLLDDQRKVLASLAKLDLEQLVIEGELDPPSNAATIVVGEAVGYLPLAGLVDLAAERGRLTKEMSDVEQRIARSEELLAGEFSTKAPDQVVDREKEKLEDLKTTYVQLKDRLEKLE